MGSPVSESSEVTSTVGDGGEVSDKYGSNSAGAGYSVKDSRAVGGVIWE